MSRRAFARFASWYAAGIVIGDVAVIHGGKEEVHSMPKLSRADTRLTVDDFMQFPDDGKRHEIIDGEHYVTPSPKNVQGAPAIVVEILSPGTRKVDEVKKRQLFERGGVREYWLIDSERNRIRIFRRDLAGELAGTEIAKEAGGILATPILPGLTVPLTELFRPTEQAVIARASA